VDKIFVWRIACVERTLLSAAFDLAIVLALDLHAVDPAFDFDREGHGFSRADNDPPKSARL
jgi:hypothetical protein